LRKTQMALRLLILMLTVYGSCTMWTVGRELIAARELLAAQEERAQALREENAQLRLRLEETDEEEWERIARQQLGLVSPEDTVIYNVGD